MTRKYITLDGVKDENGQYVRQAAAPLEETSMVSPRGLSIDELLQKGLYGCDLLLKSILQNITSHTYERDTVQNLKDVMSMLHELKKQEAALLEDLSDEELKKYLNAANAQSSGESSQA